MALFNDGIDYNTYENSTIKDDKQINNDIVITDKTNYNYTFDSTTPIESIINQLPGYIAKVTYFNKSPGNQEVYEYPDLTLDDIIVEYTKIENMILYMDSAIDATDLDNFEGEACINSGIEPQPGDFILMPLYDKRLGLFVVTNTGAVTYNFTRLFKINFKFYMFPDETDLEKINRNVAKDLVADNRLNNTGKEILYDKDRYIGLKRINELIPSYMDIWKHKIITPDTNYTISYYSNDLSLFVGDVYMERFIINMFGLTSIGKVNLFNSKNEDLTILDILINKDVSRWNINKKYEEKYIYDTLKNPFLKDFMYNQIDYFVSVGDSGDYYILSENFYNTLFTDNNYELNTIESCILNMILNKDIDIKVFNSLITEADNIIKSGNNKDIFYKIPLIITILKYFKYIHNYPDKFLY